MRIDGKKMQTVIYEQKTMEKMEKKEEKYSVRTQEKDEINLHVTGRDLKEFFDLAMKEEEVRGEKVMRLKEQYEQGQYAITGEDVILKLMGEEDNGKKNN